MRADRVIAVVVVLGALGAACGRLDFDPLEPPEPAGSGSSDGGLVSSGPPGSAIDGGAVVGDGGAIGCVPGAGSASGCAANQYCSTPPNMCSAPGECVAKPGPSDVCPTIVVCGCNGKSYATPCDAERAGVAIASVGACAM